jgi:hypothetical protein
VIAETLVALRRVCIAGLVVLAGSLAGQTAFSAEAGRNVDGIMDNSFLVEEAYNQEAGVVQHILTAAYAYERVAGDDFESWNFGFTQEWPLFSQKHQLGYSIPHLYAHGGGNSVDGLGDVLLNYRYQAYFNEETLSAFAPRFTLVLPTGDERLGVGEDTLGYQVNLPFSTTLNDKRFVHANAGATFLPGAASSDGRDLWHYNLGASTICAPTRDVHLMLEWVGYWVETTRSSGGMPHEFVSQISPGVRKAFNSRNSSQLVAGVAVPIGVTDSAPDYGVFLYLSFEHRFLREP